MSDARNGKHGASFHPVPDRRKRKVIALSADVPGMKPRGASVWPEKVAPFVNSVQEA